MKTNIDDRDLTKQAPHSPRDRFGGYAIMGRTVDKCRASINGTTGEYHYDCPLDNQLFDFKGIKGDQFKAAVEPAGTYEEVAIWLESHGNRKTPAEIKEWSDKVEATKMRDVFGKHSEAEGKEVAENCRKLGIDFETATLFEWLEADDRASFQPHAHQTAR